MWERHRGHSGAKDKQTHRPDPGSRIRDEYSRKDSIIHFLLCAMACLVLWIGWTLQPSPRGYGTHEQLGLPACTFLRLTGWPCPSCGLTTSFAHAAKMNGTNALRVQPFGFLVFWLTVLSLPFLLCLTALRIPVRKIVFQKTGLTVIYVLLCFYSAGWVYKLLTW